MLDKDRIKESLTENDIINLMEYLGSPLYSQSDTELIFQTVCHNHGTKGSNKLYYYPDSRVFNCYTSCGVMDVYSLVMHAERLTGNSAFPTAVNWVANVTGKSFRENEQRAQGQYIIDDWDFLNKYSRFKDREEEEEVKLKEISEHFLKYFIHLPHYSWIEEGISWESQQKYKICYDWRSEKIVIPHYDINGRLVGIRGRALREEDLDVGRKYMPLYLYSRDFAHALGANLYGAYENLEAIKRRKKAIIFEGEKSVIKCEDYFQEENFAVATCRNGISPIQTRILLSTGVKDIYIAMDKEYVEHGDEDSVKYAEHLYEMAQAFTPYCRVYVLWDTEGLLEEKDSPADKGREVLIELMDKSLEVTTKTKKEEEENENEYE